MSDRLCNSAAPSYVSLLQVRDVIACLVDGSRFDEFKARYGTTLVCGECLKDSNKEQFVMASEH